MLPTLLGDDATFQNLAKRNSRYAVEIIALTRLVTTDPHGFPLFEKMKRCFGSDALKDVEVLQPYDVFGIALVKKARFNLNPFRPAAR